MSKLEKYTSDFEALLVIIRQAKHKAIAQVNTTLIDLYWEIGKKISQRVPQEKWGKGIVKELANYIEPNLSDSKEMRSAKYLRIKCLQKTQAYPEEEKRQL